VAEQRTEKPTSQRLRKAREKGQFPAAKEFVSGAQFLVLTIVATAWFAGWFESAKAGFRSALLLAFRDKLDASDFIYMVRSLVVGTFLPLVPAALILLGTTLAFQIGSTNMGVSFSKLTPDFKRFNPMSKLKEIPRQNVPAMLQACALLAVVGYMIYGITTDHLPVLLKLPMASLQAGLSVVGGAFEQVLWRCTAVLVVIGAVEMFRHRWLYNKDLAMTKQEVREEHRDQEGDPQIKGRIRRIRRDLLRRQMMKEVPLATAVIVNPTHYAVAIRYESGGMASPKVVAKGQNYLALRIRTVASEAGVPIIENAPLARALYQSVEVGHEIPSDFYRAVAEVLAYIYRRMGTRITG
jgi:flagellar biosynthesis protein FlhB